MTGTVLALIPPLVTVILVFTTKRLLLSLSAGIVVGALMLHNGNPLSALQTVLGMMGSVLQGDGLVFVFVLLVGALAALLYGTGGIYAFAEWGVRVAKTRRQAQVATMGLGLVMWFDDSFSCLFRGTVMRSVTDRYNVSHSKLAYLIHSTSAPIAMLVPVSGMAIILTALIGSVFEANGVTQYSSLEAYIQTIPQNYYTLATLFIVVAVVVFNVDVGRMRQDEQRALSGEGLVNPARADLAGLEEREVREQEPVHRGRLVDLWLPVLVLVVVSLAAAVTFGLANSAGDLSVITFLANAEVIRSLVIGGLAANLVVIVRLLTMRTGAGRVLKIFWKGIATTLPGASILFLALVTAQVISQLEVGEYLASLVDGRVSMMWMPVILFIICAFMSYAIGSTLGTTALMVPIGAEIVLTSQPELLIPVIGACFSGTVFGEHTSPLSDTTILASIGSAVHPIDHILTQLPYAVLASLAGLVGFIVLGFSASTLLGLAVTLGVSFVGLVVARRYLALLEGRRHPKPVRA